MADPTLTPRERIILNSRRDPLTECWVWTGGRDIHGYGKMSVKGRTRGAHRVSYELFVGEVDEGKQLDHVCRNRACVNPWHMEEVTNGENIRRGHVARGTLLLGERAQRKRETRMRSYWKRKRERDFHSVHAYIWDMREGK